MVAGKFKQAIGLHKSPSHQPRSSSPSPPPSTKDSSIHKSSTLFSRSFGVYLPLPRSSAQVQPRPPDVSDLIRLVEELREREHRLRTELLEHKLLKETVAIVPILESQLASKSNDLHIFAKRIEALESQNQSLIREAQLLLATLEHERRDKDRRVEELEAQVAELKQKLVQKVRLDNEDLSASHRLQGLIEASTKSNLLKNLSSGKSTRSTDGAFGSNSNTFESCKSLWETKREEPPEIQRPVHCRSNSEELPETSSSALANNVRSRIPRVPKPPPKRISSTSSESSDCSLDDHKDIESSSIGVPTPHVPPAKSAPPPPFPPAKSAHPPPPPPPPPAPRSKISPPPPPPPPPPALSAKGSKQVSEKVRRVPEVVELYHSLMRRDSRRDSGAGLLEATAASARDLVGEIENRSAYLLAIKTDVETQGDFIRFLIKEVENAAFTDIEDVVLFVKWLDDELTYLVDERAVLKHFNWPEQKADAMREAAFEYCDLKKLESEASGFKDDQRQPCSIALKKMQALFDKLEHGVYNLSRLRESAANRFKSFHIPVAWMLETGFVCQIKLASVKLAMKYMKRASAELGTVGGGGAEEEELVVQGVRFAFRVHQFAGGFDVETMRAFQELRDKANTCHVQCHGQQQRLISRPAPC